MSESKELVRVSPAEVLRFFSVTRCKLVSVRDDGTVMTQALGDDWKPSTGLVRSPSVPVDLFIRGIRAKVAALPKWAQEVTELPSMAQMEEWMFDGICETPEGDMVEPDGYGPGRCPSWLRIFKLI